MANPKLVVARSGVVALLTVGGGYTDDGVVYNLLAVSQPFAPAGIGGEAIFTSLFVTTLHFDTDVAIKITPIVDNVPLESQLLLLVGVPASKGTRTIHELYLSVPYVVAMMEMLRTRPRGARIEVQVETVIGVAGASTAQGVEGIECEYEIVDTSQDPITT